MIEAIEGLKKRYPDVHPLIFHRSVERASSLGELFDILEDIPSNEMPILWDEESRRWQTTEDLCLSQKFDLNVVGG